MKWGLKGGISIDADSGPPKYEPWCCAGICQDFFTFIQIGSGHTVKRVGNFKYSKCPVCTLQNSWLFVELYHNINEVKPFIKSHLNFYFVTISRDFFLEIFIQSKINYKRPKVGLETEEKLYLMRFRKRFALIVSTYDQSLIQ